MTVEDLRQWLADLPGDLPVVVAIDERPHNEFGEVARVVSWAMYREEGGYPDIWKDDPSCFRKTSEVVVLQTDY